MVLVNFTLDPDLGSGFQNSEFRIQLESDRIHQTLSRFLFVFISLAKLRQGFYFIKGAQIVERKKRFMMPFGKKNNNNKEGVLAPIVSFCRGKSLFHKKLKIHYEMHLLMSQNNIIISLPKTHNMQLKIY